MSGVLADVMKSCPPCVDAGLALNALHELFQATDCDRVLVVDNEQLIGAVCADEFARHVCLGNLKTAGAIAGRYVITAGPQTPVRSAFQAFHSGVDRFIVVVESGRPVGCVRPSDLFGWAGSSATGNAVNRPHLFDGKPLCNESASQAG